MNAAIREHSINTHVFNASTLNRRCISYTKLYNHNVNLPFGFKSLCQTYSSLGFLPCCSLSFTSLCKVNSSHGIVPHSSLSLYSHNHPMGSVVQFRPYSHPYSHSSTYKNSLSPEICTPGISITKSHFPHNTSSNVTFVQYSHLNLLKLPHQLIMRRTTLHTQISLSMYPFPCVKLIKTQPIMNHHLHYTSVRLYTFHIDVIAINYTLPHSLVPTPINNTVHYKLSISVNHFDQAILRNTSLLKFKSIF